MLWSLLSASNNGSIEPFHKGHMLLDSGNVSVGRVQIAVLANRARQDRIINETLHLLCERERVAMLKEEPVAFVLDLFGHASAVGSDDGNMRLKRLVQD